MRKWLKLWNSRRYFASNRVGSAVFAQNLMEKQVFGTVLAAHLIDDRRWVTESKAGVVKWHWISKMTQR
jgi:hypothetical protein